jgi:cytochrome c peroxidase
MVRSLLVAALLVSVPLVLAACGGDDTTPEPADEPAPEAAPVEEAAAPDAAHLAMFKPLPAEMSSESNPLSEEKIALGRMLYYEPRLSKNHDLSCNSCHGLDTFGVDNKPTSPGHKGALGTRNSPTVYNAALHIAQFWDGREPDVEAQAKGPVLNPVEMAMASEEAVVVVLKTIPGYVTAFAAAWPDDADAVTYDHMADAIGAFERKLVTPDRFDEYLGGDGGALTPEERAGLDLFVSTGCITCHMGAGLGGAMYQKLGLVEPYETADTGRHALTGNDADKFFFKVPSLRNITRTGPYLHDGSVADLGETVSLMAKYELGRELTDEEVASMVTFFGALEGTIPTEYIAMPTLPESGPDTPAPDPS